MKRTGTRKGSAIDETLGLMPPTLNVRKQSIGSRRLSVVDGVPGGLRASRAPSPTPPGGQGKRDSIAASLAASAGGQDSKRPKFTIWPEWNDADVNAEKWTYGTADAAKKEDKKGKSPTVAQHFFEDPDGKIEMPPSLKVDTWKRPTDFIQDKVPVIVDTDNIINGFDLIANNEYLHESEFLRYCISQVMVLWDMSTVSIPPDATIDSGVPGDDPSHIWRPWEHIYALCKAGKGPHLPVYNNHGKYVIRLYWMGCWRKITIDDTIPFDDQGRMLLPSTTLQHELWPMLLTKALIKVASLDYAGGNPSQEFGDVSVLQCLTGWIPEAIPLQPSYMNEVWDMMKTILPEWKLPEQEWEKPQEVPETTCKESTPSEGAPKEERIEKDGTQKDMKDGKGEKGKDGKDKGKDGKEKEKGKDDKKDKKDKEKDKDKDKDRKEKSSMDDVVLPDKPEIVVFATYSSTPKYPVKVSILGEMADASEKLRQNGLSHMYPHPVCITQTRSCPLEPPPPPVVIPAWKLIRPRKRKSPPHDEPVLDPEPPKEIQCLEITSPFVNYKVSAVPIPTDIHRPKSSLERGGARSRADTEVAIEEMDENAPTPPAVTPEPPPPPVPVEEVKEEDEPSKDKPGTPKRKASGKSVRSGKPGSASKERSPHKRPESRQLGKTEETKTEKPKEGGVKADILPPGAPPLGGTTAGGLAPPPNPVIGPDGESLMGEEELVAEPPQDNSPKPKKAWMDFDIFCKCFRTLYIFHKSNTYPCNQRYSDLKSVTPSTTAAPSKTEKRPPQASSAPSDGSPFYLFVDNLSATDIVVSYSVLARWFDPPLPAMEEKKSLSQIKQGKDKDLDKEPTNASISLDSVVGEQKPPPPVVAGTLVAEPYSWKSLVTGQPILRLRTTGTKSAVLSLPPGRHVLRFMMSSPLGHHVHMCSTVDFTFGDEETVMPKLTNESCRFRDNASQCIVNLGKSILGFKDAELFKSSWEELVRTHCPYLNDKQMSKTHHFQIFNEALYQMLKKTVKEIISPDVAFAWRAFTFDVTSPNILSIPVGSRPGTQGSTAPATGSASVRGSAKPSSKKRGFPSTVTAPDSQTDQGEAEKPENPWANREATIEEQIAAVKIQRLWRGYYVRKIKQARIPGTEENLKASENLSKCWPLIESNTEENGLLLLREMFKREPDIMPYYPFYKDEWNKISYADYKGVFPDQPSMNWFIVFRDIFYVKEEMLVVPSLYVPINTCMLRVIDNDTGMEIPRVFQKVAPYVYKRNKKGYSFVAEARTVEQPLPSGNWRMRLIGSLNVLPTPQSGEVCCNFVTKELKDYYIPNPKNIIFRQTVKVAEDHFASLQVNTSRQSVYIKLAVLDNEEEVISAVGKGHVVIPAFTFLKDITQEDIDNRRSSSRASVRGSVPGAPPVKAEKTTSKLKRTESAVSNEQHPPSRSSMRSDAELAERLEDTRPHKYVIQATVLQNSWPLSEGSWRFVQMLKEMERNELKVSNKERPPSPPKVEKTPATGGSKAKPKGGKDKGGKDKGQDGKGSRPSSQQFDITKPNWILRVVSDAPTAEEIEVKKDTERADEIRAMKKAWEDAEPGRAAKALQSRLKYINSHTIKLGPSEESSKEDQTSESVTVTGSGVLVTGESATATDLESAQAPQTPISLGDNYESETTLTLEPPPLPTQKEMLEPLDMTPFIRKSQAESRFLDESELQRMLEQRQKEIAEYKAFREGVEHWRETDKQIRNKTKLQQLEQCQALQAALDTSRERINIPREAIRQRFLDAEQQRMEDLANQEAAMKAELESKSPKGRKKSPAGKKKK